MIRKKKIIGRPELEPVRCRSSVSSSTTVLSTRPLELRKSSNPLATYFFACLLQFGNNCETMIEYASPSVDRGTTVAGNDARATRGGVTNQ